MKKWISFFLVALIIFAPFSVSAKQLDEKITRGEFFKLVVEHLDLKAANTNVELPIDVKEDSEFASAVKVLKSRGIVNGYTDGTVRLNQEISNKEMSYIIGRVLNIDDQQAASALTEKFSIDLKNSSAQDLVSKALTSDSSALELIEKMTIAQSEVDSFSAYAIFSMEMKMKKEMLEQAPGMPSTMKMDGALQMDFNKEQGFRQEMSMTSPVAVPNVDSNMKMVQYIVPEGIFMQMPDPATGEETWVNMSDSMPLTFEQLMQMNEDSLKVNAELNNKFFFYRDLGTVKIDGKTLRKIEMTGKITSLSEMMGMLNGVVDTSMIPKETQQLDMKMGMSGITLVDEETGLPYSQTLDYTVHFLDGENAAMPNPLDVMSMKMEMAYSDFNNVKNINLPEEAKNAEKLPMPGQVAQPSEITEEKVELPTEGQTQEDTQKEVEQQ